MPTSLTGTVVVFGYPHTFGYGFHRRTIFGPLKNPLVKKGVGFTDNHKEMASNIELNITF